MVLAADLGSPALNGVSLGSRFDLLSSLGRDSKSLSYFDLGIDVGRGNDGAFQGYSIVLEDQDGEFEPYRGSVLWNGKEIDANALTTDNLPSVLGEWYWMDTDEFESIAFFEYPTYELQVELTLSGRVKRFILTRDPLMADPVQREAYKVDKPWPPEYRPGH